MTDDKSFYSFINTPIQCSSEPDKLLEEKTDEIIEKLGISFNKLNNKSTRLLEENLNLQLLIKWKTQEIEQLQQFYTKYNNLQKIVEEKDNIIKNFEVEKLNLYKKIDQLQTNNKILNDENRELKDYVAKATSAFSLSGSFNKSTENFGLNGFKVIVGLDFGTTYSGFAYCHVSESKNICSDNLWHGLKTNHKNNIPVESFKLHLSDIPNNLKPKLPVDYKKAITDYFREIEMVIKTTFTERWPRLNVFENVLLVLPIPAEYSGKAKDTMRECLYNAGLLEKKDSPKLQFTTELEALAVSCIENENALTKLETTSMVVDCGDKTISLTTWKLNNKLLGGITARSNDFCGSTFIDSEFIKYLRIIFGDKPMDLLRDNNYGKMQYMIQQFCKFGKIPFTGEDPDFLYELDIQDTIPILKRYVTNSNVRETLEENEWVIEIDFESMKSIFEPVIQKILCLIKAQLDNTQETCSVMFLVGGFSESKYLQKRIKKEFSHRVNNISVPTQPTTAIARGAVIYGRNIILASSN